MISIIISTYRPALLQQLQENISSTIGVPYEIIAVENNGAMGICAAYNSGAAKAAFEILCFIHEDLQMLTPGWGQVLISQLQDIDVLGVAGAVIKSDLITGWQTSLSAYDFAHVYHGAGKHGALLQHTGFSDAQLLQQVVTLDGVFIACHAAVWQTIQFSPILTGFHFYDVDFSFRASQHYKVGVSAAIDLVHFSTGRYNHEWVSTALAWHAANKSLLKRLNPSETDDIRIAWYINLRFNVTGFFRRLAMVRYQGWTKKTLIVMLEFLMQRRLPRFIKNILLILVN